MTGHYSSNWSHSDTGTTAQATSVSPVGTSTKVTQILVLTLKQPAWGLLALYDWALFLQLKSLRYWYYGSTYCFGCLSDATATGVTIKSGSDLKRFIPQAHHHHLASIQTSFGIVSIVTAPWRLLSRWVRKWLLPRSAGDANVTLN
jgi:hypothetical protein